MAGAKQNKLRVVVLSALALSVYAMTGLVGPASAQERPMTAQLELAHTWTLADVYFEFVDGRRVKPYGPNVKGRLIFDEHGLFSLQITGADRPKFISSNRREGTPEENATVVRQTESIFGTYTLDAAGRTIVLHLERSMFPNWDGTERAYKFTISGDELLTVAPDVPSANGTYVPHHTWKRSR
jgi:hypothetical protein